MERRPIETYDRKEQLTHASCCPIASTPLWISINKESPGEWPPSCQAASSRADSEAVSDTGEAGAVVPSCPDSPIAGPASRSNRSQARQTAVDRTRTN